MREGGQYTFGRQAEASVSLIQSAPTATDDTRTQTIADPEPTVQPETLTINPDFGQERADLLLPRATFQQSPSTRFKRVKPEIGGISTKL